MNNKHGEATKAWSYRPKKYESKLKEEWTKTNSFINFVNKVNLWCFTAGSSDSKSAKL